MAQNQTIPSNDNEVTSAMDNLAKAHGEMANADMQQMAMYGQLDKDVISTDNTLGSFIGKERYYNSLGDVQGYLTQASQLANNHIQEINNPIAYDNKGNLIDPIHQLNKSNALYFAKINGLVKNINDSNIPDNLKYRTLREIDNYNTSVTNAYNKSTGYQVASRDLNSLKVATSSIKTLHPDKVQLDDLNHNSIAILNNPYATQEQKQEAYNIHSNILLRMAHPEAQSIPLSDNEHVTEATSSALGNQAIDNTIKNIFLSDTDLSPSINYSADPSKNAQLYQQFNEIKNIKQELSQSHNIPAFLDGMLQSINPMKQRIAKVLLPIFKKNMGDYVLRGGDPQLQSLYDEYNKNPNYNTWQAYSTRLHKQAEQAGIHMSNVGDLPMDVNNTLTEVNKDYQNQNYTNELYDSLAKTKLHMGNMPVYGTSDNANMVRLFNYGDESKNGFNSFVASVNPNYAKEVNTVYKQFGSNKTSFVSDYMSENERSLKTVATAVQIPQDKFNNYVQTHLKSMINNGMSESEAKANMNDILQGYINTGNHDIGSNYIVNNKLFSDMGVTDNYTKYDVANNAIQLAYNKQVNDIAKQSYASNKSISLDAYKTRIKDNLGQPSDYTIVSSNGQLFAKNNFTGREIPMNDATLKTAHDYVMQMQSKPKKQLGFWWQAVSTMI